MSDPGDRDDVRLFVPTEKQTEVMSLVVKGNADGTFIDLDQLLERLSYRPSKSAIHTTIRSLIKWEVLEKAGTEVRRAARRRILKATPQGYATFRPST